MIITNENKFLLEIVMAFLSVDPLSNIDEPMRS